MERKLRIANHQITGSRLGFVSPGLSIIAVTGPMSGMSFAGETFYKAEYWRTNRYFEWQDKMWHAPDSTGHVDVGDVQKVPDETEPDQPSRVRQPAPGRSEEHTSELQSLMRISYAVFCLKKKNKNNNIHYNR